jgi:nicotinate phosphoribosyltransferase
MTIVRSLLENDLYKFTMWQALLHSHPGAQTEYTFFCRNTPAYPLARLKADVERELDHLCSLSFTEDELSYMRNLRFIKSDFVDFLTVFRFQRKFIKVEADDDQLRIASACDGFRNIRPVYRQRAVLPRGRRASGLD